VSKHISPVVAVSAAVWSATGELLVIARDNEPGAGLWSLPGGKLEALETLSDGVIREVHEETGLQIEVGPLIEVIERMSATEPTYHYIILDFVGRVTADQSTTPVAASDARAARFIGVSELVAMPAHQLTEGLLPIVEKARALARQLKWIPT
jgi:8-oxo-dGTP diphosphatase